MNQSRFYELAKSKELSLGLQRQEIIIMFIGISHDKNRLFSASFTQDPEFEPDCYCQISLRGWIKRVRNRYH